MSSRSEILGRIRANIHASGVAPCPTQVLPTRKLDSKGREILVRAFAENLEQVAGHCHGVDSMDEATAALRSIIEGQQAVRLARSDDASVIDLVERSSGECEIATPTSPQSMLLDCQVGVTTAALGIAEHGTIVLPSGESDLGRERTRLVALLPLVHVAILRASDLVGTISEALERIAAMGEGDRSLPPMVTFATGPSRTADIEQQLVLGVHGPHAQHVILLMHE